MAAEKPGALAWGECPFLAACDLSSGIMCSLRADSRTGSATSQLHDVHHLLNHSKTQSPHPESWAEKPSPLEYEF